MRLDSQEDNRHPDEDYIDHLDSPLIGKPG
jgi:hypothetical protein